MKTIHAIIVGYGNVGRGIRCAIANNPDIELAGIISRNPARVLKEVNDVPVLPMSDYENAVKELKADVALLAGGSKDDLPKQGPMFAKLINTIDTFDNHSRVPEYFAMMDEAAKSTGHLSVISVGWDPGIFSLERVLADSFLPGSRAYGFYGLGPAGGLSMGHSDALRTIPGVKDARQYTHAVPEAIEAIRRGEKKEFEAGDMHTRECFVVLEEGADPAKVTEAIVSMPGYFAPYDTTVNFVSQEELKARFSGFPHDGLVIASGKTGSGNAALVEYRCQWGSNPEATANVLVAHARAVARLTAEGKTGAMTILDIPPCYFSRLSREELLKGRI